MKATASNQSISWFYQRYRENSLELSPDFQRNPVWLQNQKEYLLETVLLELPMPEIYMVNRILPSGDSTYIVVDGQQRLRTILEFVTGELYIKNPLERFPFLRTFTDLNDQEKQKFWRYPIVVRDLEDSTDDEIRNLFQRLNKYSAVLNDQELRNAKFKGQFLKTVQQLSSNDFWTSAGIFSANDFRRMIDLEFISILLTTMIGGIYNRRDRLDEFYLMYEDEFEEVDSYVNKVTRILDLIDLVVPTLKVSRWKNKAEFYTLFLVFDDMELFNITPDNVPKLSELLSNFERQVQLAKNAPEEVDKRFVDYLDAATYGTNDKEKRVRRNRILQEYLREGLERTSRNNTH